MDVFKEKVLGRLFRQMEETDSDLYRRFALTLGVPKPEARQILNNLEKEGIVKKKIVYPGNRYYERVL